MIIFDCDGVLVDTEMAEAEVDAEMLALHGYPITVRELKRRFTGIARRDSFAAMFAELGRPVPPGLQAEAETRLAARYRIELPVIPGIRAALDALRGIAKCVASSSTEEKLALKLELAGLTADFAPHIYSTALVARSKPAPDIYLHAAAAMRCTPVECLVIEDSVAGVTGAKAAGMRVIGFTGAAHVTPQLADELRSAGADHVIASMEELPASVRAMLA